MLAPLLAALMAFGGPRAIAPPENLENVENFENVEPSKNVESLENLEISKSRNSQSSSRPLWQRGIVGKLVNYFDRADDPKPLDRFDFSIIGGPNYNATAGFGIGLCGAALYHLSPSDTTLRQSSLTINAQATTKGMFRLLVQNDNFLPRDRFRSHIRLEMTNFRNNFWGLGYEQNDQDANQCRFTCNQIEFQGNFGIRLARNLYLGPSLYYNFLTADRRDSLCNALLSPLPHKEQGASLGLNLGYDTRDHIHDAHRGLYLNLEQRLSPAPFNTRHTTFTTTELQLCGYQPAWRGCTIAAELHTTLNIGHAVPWTQYAKVGSECRMRGYYYGRYRDRNIIEAQLEFRQHLWKRIGMVWWLGAANSFHDTQTWQFRHTLPNYGLGLRWRFKPGVNIRLDYGFARRGSGFLFSINEAF